ncbi:MAG: AMP phosphorylase [Candidatus Heimdallarchaeota archaeon]|nr:AMP phosphorylase [Candidatus Heimdallarchaeota archaeon]
MIRLPVKILDIRSVDSVMMISKDTASNLKLRHDSLVTLKSDIQEIVMSPIVVQDLISDDVAAISPKDAEWLGLKEDDMVTILARKPPITYDFIKTKIGGNPWSINEVTQIVNDISRRKLTKVEVSTFALVSQFHGYNNDELVTMTKAMAEAGTQFDFKEPVYEKHSIGGIPGNKVSPVIVAIIAAAGLLIPKTSSRAITSPAGTADTMEVLANVSFTPEEVSEIAPKSRGMIVWNAPLELSPLDDIVIGVKRELGIDPQDQMLASIVSTKVAMGVDKLVFDIPTGPQTKMPSRAKAIDFAHDLIGLCRQVDIGVESALTLGNQPLGNNIGPSLEAREALEVLEGRGPNSVIEKSIELAGILLEMAGLSSAGNGATTAHEYIKTGKALVKFQEIIEAQGGDPDMTSKKVEVGTYTDTVKAATDGYISSIDNRYIKKILSAAGCPRDKLGGMVLHKKNGEFVSTDDPLYTIYTSSDTKLTAALQVARTQNPYTIEGMIISRISSISEKNI